MLVEDPLALGSYQEELAAWARFWLNSRGLAMIAALLRSFLHVSGYLGPDFPVYGLLLFWHLHDFVALSREAFNIQPFPRPSSIPVSSCHSQLLWLEFDLSLSFTKVSCFCNIFLSPLLCALLLEAGSSCDNPLTA